MHAEFQYEMRSVSKRRMHRGQQRIERSRQTLTRYLRCCVVCWTPLRQKKQGDSVRRKTSSTAPYWFIHSCDQLTNSRIRSKFRTDGAFGWTLREWRDCWKPRRAITRNIHAELQNRVVMKSSLTRSARVTIHLTTSQARRVARAGQRELRQ